MGRLLHIVLCSMAAIGGWFAVGLAVPSQANVPATTAQSRYYEPGLMAVPVVRAAQMQGFVFLRLGLRVDAGLALDDAALASVVADALYHTMLPQPSGSDGRQAFDLSFLKAETLSQGVVERVNAVLGAPTVREVFILQLDARAHDHLRAPTLRAVIEP